MAESWIRVRAHLSKTRVAEKLAPLVRGDRQKAVGVLVDFWSGVAEFALNGFIRDKDDQTLEDYASWRGKRGAFAAWVRSQHMDDDGRVPHWDEYMGQLEVRKLIDRERKRLERGEKSTGRPQDCPADNPLDSPDSVYCYGDEDGTERKKKQNKTPTTARAELIAALATPSRRYGMDACIRVWEQGLDLPPGLGVPTAEHIEKACREVLGGVDTAELRPRVVRGFLVRVMRGEAEPTPTRAAARGASGWDNVQ